MKYIMLILLLATAWSGLSIAGKLPAFNELRTHADEKFKHMHSAYMCLFGDNARENYEQHQYLDREGLIQVLRPHLYVLLGDEPTAEEKKIVCAAYGAILSVYPAEKKLSVDKRARFKELSQKIFSDEPTHSDD